MHPPAPDPYELILMLEAHIASLNTELALNTMALAAFGIAPAHLDTATAGQHQEDRWGFTAPGVG